MKHFELVHQGLDVAPMLADLAAHPVLWDQHKERRTAAGSPHAQMQDIWCRARTYDDIDVPNAFREPHYPAFYPAWRALPSIQPVVYSLMATTQAVHLGNVLLTRIPVGGEIKPHADTGWAPEWFNTKFYVVLQSDRCVNRCEDESVMMQAGEVWRFENRVTHSVENWGGADRISLIVTMRVEA